VTLRRCGDELRVTVQDDGVGPDEHPGTGSGLGTASMRERAEEVGGACTMTTAPGGGTLVEARLPLAPPAGEAHAGTREES
jgi:signal transduction histidine kinase